MTIKRFTLQTILGVVVAFYSGLLVVWLQNNGYNVPIVYYLIGLVGGMAAMIISSV